MDTRDGQIRVSYKLNNVEGHDRLKAQLQKAVKQTNCDVHGHECHQGLFARNLYLGQRLPLAAVAHQNGTVRFGECCVMDAKAFRFKLAS